MAFSFLLLMLKLSLCNCILLVYIEWKKRSVKDKLNKLFEHMVLIVYGLLEGHTYTFIHG